MYKSIYSKLTYKSSSTCVIEKQRNIGIPQMQLGISCSSHALLANTLMTLSVVNSRSRVSQLPETNKKKIKHNLIIYRSNPNYKCMIQVEPFGQ
jgi:hypothetical protein